MQQCSIDSNIWFTSDHHFGLTKLLECNRFGPRPFTSIEQMDEALISGWNSCVKDQDIVWLVGDFACYEGLGLQQLFHRLKGQKHLIIGNHDQENKHVLDLPWSSEPSLNRLIKIEQTEIFLSHFPMRCWPRFNWGSIHLYGHTHGGLNRDSRSLDVGVDCWQYKPVSYQQVMDTIGNSDDACANVYAY